MYSLILNVCNSSSDAAFRQSLNPKKLMKTHYRSYILGVASCEIINLTSYWAFLIRKQTRWPQEEILESGLKVVSVIQQKTRNSVQGMIHNVTLMDGSLNRSVVGRGAGAQWVRGPWGQSLCLKLLFLTACCSCWKVKKLSEKQEYL